MNPFWLLKVVHSVSLLVHDTFSDLNDKPQLYERSLQDCNCRELVGNNMLNLSSALTQGRWGEGGGHDYRLPN